jgi:hypothetical protein
MKGVTLEVRTLNKKTAAFTLESFIKEMPFFYSSPIITKRTQVTRRAQEYKIFKG